MPDDIPENGGETAEPSIWDRLDAIPDLDRDDSPIEIDETGLEPTRVVSTTPTPTGENPIPAESLAAPPRRPGPAPAPPLDVAPSRAEQRQARRQRRRATRRRRRIIWLVTTIALLLVVLIGVPLFGAWYMWGKVDKVDAGNGLASGGGVTNYLIVGTDTRDEAGDLIGDDVPGGRSDTLLILHIDGSGGNRLLSIPRDLLVSYPDGSSDRVNAALVFGGPQLLIEVVTANLAIPVHHYMEVDLSGFLGVVDAVGGVRLDIPSAVCDPKSGLDIRTPGVQQLDPDTALAYVRSRTFTTFEPAGTQGLTCDEIIAAGLGTVQPTADLGRVERQRDFLTAVFDKVGATRNPLTLYRVLDGFSGGLRVDDGMSVWDALALARRLGGLNAETETLGPTAPQTVDGKSVLVLDRAAADSLLNEYRS